MALDVAATDRQWAFPKWIAKRPTNDYHLALAFHAINGGAPPTEQREMARLPASNPAIRGGGCRGPL